MPATKTDKPGAPARKTKGAAHDVAAPLATSDRIPDDIVPSKPCCCPPVARVWIDARTHCCFVENAIDMKRRLLARADANASIRAPGGPDVDAEGAGGSQLDEGTFKHQGKVYRIDEYTVHWQADGHCRPLSVSLRLGGDISYAVRDLPEQGQVTLSHSYILEPPRYDAPGKTGVTATLCVADCAGNYVENWNAVPRP